MQTREWTYRDKSDWPRGPWDSEPDKRQWTDVEQSTEWQRLIGGDCTSKTLCDAIRTARSNPSEPN